MPKPVSLKKGAQRGPIEERPSLNTGVVAVVVVLVTFLDAALLTGPLLAMRSLGNVESVDAIIAQLYVTAGVSSLLFAVILFALARVQTRMSSGSEANRENYRTALAYTPKGGKIDVALMRTDGRVRFTIHDNGIGIPAAEQPRVWQRFFRATNAPTMKPDASGLGLFIAKHFIEQHGGTIGFESAEGKGTAFWFELPVK